MGKKKKKKPKKKLQREAKASPSTKDTAPGKATASTRASEASSPEPATASPATEPAPSDRPKTPPTTRSLRVAPPSPPGLMARLFTTGHHEPGLVWGVWLFNLLAAVAWNLACYPFINRLMKGTSTPGIKLLDFAVALIGVFLTLRVVTLLSDLKQP